MSRVALCSVMMLSVLGGSAAAEDTPPAEGLRLMRAIAAQLPAFDLPGAPAVFTSHDLWSHINGDADRYLAYQFQWAATAMLVRRDSGQRVSVDAYRFATDLDAFGAHSMDRSRNSVTGLALPGGASSLAAYLEVDQLRVWRGPFAVVISPVRRRGTAVDVALEVGRAACRELPPHAGVPWLLRLCPPSDMLVSTLRYQRSNVFGRAWLGHAALATYGTRVETGQPSTRFELAVFSAGSAQGAEHLGARLTAMLGDEGTCRAAPELPGKAVASTHLRFGEARLVTAGHVVALAHHIRDEQAALEALRILASRIR